MNIWTDPEHKEWRELSERTNDFVDRISGRGDIIVKVTPDVRSDEEKKKRSRPPGVFYPTLGRLHLDASQTLPKNLVELSTINLASKLSQRRYPAFAGVSIHESGHAKHSIHNARHDDRFINEWIAVLEEPRSERKMALEYPQYIPHLRAASKHIFGTDAFVTPNLNATKELAKRYEAARVAILLLGRSDADILAEEEVSNIRDLCIQALGKRSFEKLRQVWLDAFKLEDADSEGMVALGIRVQKIVDPSNEAKDNGKEEKRTPCGSPEPPKKKEKKEKEEPKPKDEEPKDDSEDSEEEGSDSDDSKGDGSDSEDSEGEGTDSEDSESDGSDSESEGSDSDDSEGEGSDSEDSEGDGSDSESEGSDSDDSEGEGSDSEDSEGEGSDSDDSEGEGTDSDDSEGEGSDSDDSEGEGTDSDDSKGEGSDSDDSEGEGTKSDDSKGEGSDSSKESDSSKGSTPDDELKGDSAPSGIPGEDSEDENSSGGEDSEEGDSTSGNDSSKDSDSSDGEEADEEDASDSEPDVDSASADREVQDDEISDLIREAIVSVDKATEHGTTEAKEDGKVDVIVATHNQVKEDHDHRQEINKAKEGIKEGNTKKPTTKAGIYSSVPVISLQEPSVKDVARARAISVAIEKAQFRDVHKTTLNSLIPPGRFNVRQAMNRSSQLAMKQEITATPWKQTRRREIDNPPITLAVASDISGSMELWQREVSSFTWAFSQAVHRLKGKSGAVAWNSDTYSLIKPGIAPQKIPVSNACGGSNGLPGAMMALDGAMDLSFGEGVRVLAIITDGDLMDYGRIQKIISKLAMYGVKVMWILTDPRGWKPQHATVAILKNPEEFGTVVGMKVIEALSKA